MLRILAVTAILLVATGGSLWAQCEPSAPVRQILEKAALLYETSLTMAEQNSRRAAIYEQGLAEHPHDYFLLRAQMDAEDEQDAQIRWAKSLREKYPDQPVYVLLHARALMGRDTPQAIRMLEALKAAHPEMAGVYYELVGATGVFGRFRDTARAKTELETFLKLCPAPLDRRALSAVAQAGSADQIARTAQAARRRLEQESDPLLSGVWAALWRLEFKAHPPAEHEALRKQIAQDLARFEKVPERRELRWMTFLRGGYESAGDLAAVNKTNDEILKEYPASDTAKGLLKDRWRKEHPYPRDPDQAQIEAWWRASLAANQEWHKLWPQDSLLLDQVFSALTKLPDTTADQIAKTGDELMTLYRANPSWYGMPPVEFRVAEAFVKYKVNLDKVPALVGEGYRASLKRNEERLADDRFPDELRTSLGQSIDTLKIERARVLLDYYAALKQPDKAREIEAELASLNPAKPGPKSDLLQRRAQAAELLGRKLDALMMYRAALELRPPGQSDRDRKDTLAENVERLWKELGGTPSAYPLLIDQRKPTEAVESRWERPKNPLPSFSLTDLDGKTWKLASLQGKVLLINVWATWCGPCRQEHPEFQKLYDKLKDRSDVTVISFTVDYDLGKVAPYMKENSYTFPVMPAQEVVDAVLPAVAIPQNWFVDAKGNLQWMQVGFDGDPKWQEMITAKLNEVLKGR